MSETSGQAATNGSASTSEQQPAAESATTLLRVTLVSNRNQKQRTTVVSRSEDISRSALLQAARNKLRLSKARRIFLSVPGEQRRDGNVVYELFASSSSLHHDGNDTAVSSRHNNAPMTSASGASSSTAPPGSSHPSSSSSSSSLGAEDRTTEDDLRMLRATLLAKKDRALVLFSCGEDYIGKETVVVAAALPGGPMSRSACCPEASVLILADRTQIDEAAVQQLHATAQMEGMRACVGMPDLHAGNQFPVGAAFVADRVYPALIGGDIGCGMSLFALSGLRRSQLEGKEPQVAERLRGLEGPWEQDASAALREAGVHSATAHSFASSLGTVGRGNHFAELQVLDRVLDAPGFEALGLEENGAYLLVHSGSRGFGAAVLDAFIQANGRGAGLVAGTEEHTEYMKQHDEALAWARCNRDVIAHRIFSSLNLLPDDQRKVIDIWHNNVCEHGEGGCLFLHRKGAAPTDQGVLIIPGSRGTLTYLARPTGNQERNAHSAAHGAGREMSRSKARASIALAGKSSSRRSEALSSLQRNQYGGLVICEDKDLLCEEAPEAYKAVDDVVADLESAGVLQVVANLKPLVTYKMRN